MIFRRELAAAIIKGEKTQTRRRVSENPQSPWCLEPLRYPVGKEFAVQPGRGKTGVAHARVIARRIEPLGFVGKIDSLQEGFANAAAFREAWEAINGSWAFEEEVHVVVFKLVGPDCMSCDGCGWCEGSPAFDCPDCFATGIEISPEARQLVEEVEQTAGSAASGVA